MRRTKHSFVELNARERAKAILDAGTFREILGPFERLESPHLLSQGIVPQSDDGIVLGRGLIDGESAIVISIESAFLGGGIGEVAGAKIAGSLELALRDHQSGIHTRPVVVFDTGGVRLQEANYGLLSISEICAAVVALRRYTPVVGVIPGKVGCFGGMSITAALFSTLIMTKEGRFGLNGPEVIEQEAGIEEFDSADRQLIWRTIGGEQRHATGFVDQLVDDEVSAIKAAVQEAFSKGIPDRFRTEQTDRYLSLLQAVDPQKPFLPLDFRHLWEKGKGDESMGNDSMPKGDGAQGASCPPSRGSIWFSALTGLEGPPSDSDVPSVWHADVSLGMERVRYISVVPNAAARFPRARRGEVGLEEGWTIAKYVRQAIEQDKDGERRAIVAIVDVPSQAYGYREELLGIHYACAAAADAYAQARMAGHPVIALLVGNAISGAFLAHGLQANRILALNDSGVNVQAMSKESAMRITRRTMDEFEEAARLVPAMAYDIRSFSRLGALHALIHDVEADFPREKDIQTVLGKIAEAISEARRGPFDLSYRLQTEAALSGGRAASIQVRSLLEEQWS